MAKKQDASVAPVSKTSSASQTKQTETTLLTKTDSSSEWSDENVLEILEPSPSPLEIQDTPETKPSQKSVLESPVPSDVFAAKTSNVSDDADDSFSWHVNERAKPQKDEDPFAHLPSILEALQQNPSESFEQAPVSVKKTESQAPVPSQPQTQTPPPLLSSEKTSPSDPVESLAQKQAANQPVNFENEDHKKNSAVPQEGAIRDVKVVSAGGDDVIWVDLD